MALPLLAEGEFALVVEYLEKALQIAIDPAKWGSCPSQLDVQAMFADASARQRDREALERYAPLLERGVAESGHRLYQGVAHRAWGVAYTLAGEYGEAAKRLKRALRLFRRLGTEWQVGRTMYEMGELAVAKGDAVAAREHFRRALTAFEEMGAAPDAERVRGRLETLGN